jgi:ribosomal protein S18 acetylase RimI-like enzyme
MITYHVNEDISYPEYVDFLSRSDLGSQYPKERFEPRVSTTLRNRTIGISARDESGRLIGVCLGLTDFAYFLFITDLGVDRSFERLGVGTALVDRLHQEAGGPDDISVITIANSRAIPFYKKLGYRQDEALVWRECAVWTPFVVSKAAQ